MRDLERFSHLLRRDLVPLLYSQGFEACGSVFLRSRGERIDIVSLQGLRRERLCWLDLGVHFAFLPPSGRPPGAAPADATLRPHDCAFRERLQGTSQAAVAPPGWSYGSDDATALANAADLVDTYRRRAPVFFSRFEPFPEVFDAVLPAQLGDGGHPLLPQGHSPAHSALMLARLMKHLGRNDRCQEFAETGLRLLDSYTRLRPALEQLRDGL